MHPGSIDPKAGSRTDPHSDMTLNTSMPVTRRRCLGVMAAGVAAGLAPGALANIPLARWQGFALGGDVAITIRDPDRRRAVAAIKDFVADIARVEQIFSLHRPDSSLLQLNEAGYLDNPPSELVSVFRQAAEISAISEGAFDVTVQPLWNGPNLRAIKEAFGRLARTPSGAIRLQRFYSRQGHGGQFPPPPWVKELVDWRKLSIHDGRIHFLTPGMEATLDGIAQGYATDRIAERLRANGFPHVLVNLGEFRGLGEKAAAQPWQVGVAWPDREGIATVLSLSERAVATSAQPPGLPTWRGHLLDPKKGRPSRTWNSVSVVAPTALQADALSTAIAAAPADTADTILRRGGGELAILIDAHGTITRLSG